MEPTKPSEAGGFCGYWRASFCEYWRVSFCGYWRVSFCEYSRVSFAGLTGSFEEKSVSN